MPSVRAAPADRRIVDERALVLEEPWADQVERPADGRDRFLAELRVGAGVEQRVLGVERRHVLVVPHLRTHDVDWVEALLREQALPEALPALVLVIDPALQRDRGREQNDRGEPHELLDECMRGGRRQVLCHLDRDRQVEALLYPERPGQVTGEEPILWDEQRAAIDVVAVDAQATLDPGVEEGADPGPDAATDVDDGADLQQFEDQRRDLRAERRLLVRLRGVEIGVVEPSGGVGHSADRKRLPVPSA